MTLTELSVAARMNGMSYGQFVFQLRQDKIQAPSIEEIRQAMKKVDKKKAALLCIFCGREIYEPVGKQRFCSTTCRVKHYNAARDRGKKKAQNRK